MKTALTIAASDSSGGAGIQADIKTMTVNGVYAMSAITAITAQNTVGVYGIMEVPPDFLRKQLEAVIIDIRPDAVKVGMVASDTLIHVIADCLEQYQLKNVVVDPVMVATSGSRLLNEEAIEVLEKELLPKASLITPNIPEAEVLTGMEIHGEEDMIIAAKKLHNAFGCDVLLKGGHQINSANDLLYTSEGVRWFNGRKIDNPNTHGTGCTLSSAIASNLAKGENMENAVRYAKDYVSGALEAMLDLGKGSGPMNHAFYVDGDYLLT